MLESKGGSSARHVPRGPQATSPTILVSDKLVRFPILKDWLVLCEEAPKCMYLGAPEGLNPATLESNTSTLQCNQFAR